MKKKKASQPKPPMSLVLHPKKAPRQANKILPSLRQVQEPPATARPKASSKSKASSKRNPRSVRAATSSTNNNNNNNNKESFPSLPNAPLKPSDVLSNYPGLLTERERFEIERYHDIFYIRKNIPDPQSHMLYDPDFFPFVLDDHIKYQYQQLAELGRGAFGCVLKCFDHKNQRIVAVKLVRDKPKLHQQVQLEREVLEALMARSEIAGVHHIIKVHDIFMYRSFAVFVFEVLSSNLYDALKANRFKGLDLPKLQIVTRQSADSIAYIHSLGLIHCDIKPENILWTGARRSAVKLIDFGCCCYANHTLFTYIQSRFYRAPEVILGLDYGQEIDIWSLGCVICELITGRPIFGGEDENEQMALFISTLGPPPKELLDEATRKELFFGENNQHINKPNTKGKKHEPNSRPLKSILNVDDDLLLDLIRSCLKWLPEERITAEQIVKHPWMNNSPGSTKRAPDSAR